MHGLQQTTTTDTTFTGDIAVESAKISEIRHGRGKGSWQTGTNLYKDEYLSLSPSAAATTVGILAVRQKSYGTGSSPSIFHASLFLPSLSPDGGGRGVASPGAQTLPFPRTEHTLEEKTPVRVRLRSVRLSRSISEKWIDMHTAWSLERGRADQPTDRPES